MKTDTLDIRGLDYHVQEWGQADQPTLILLHGWMDCGATFKYVADHLSSRFHVVAPDLRGFGRTQHAQGYWFPDYFADLEEILDYYTPDQPAHIVGHSMGGNIALMYAGIRPERVARVLSLEALGMAPTTSADAPVRYRTWLREILSGEPSKVYPNVTALKMSIAKGNPSLSENMIEELVELWGEPFGEDGAYRLKHDHKHRYANPVRYNFDDVVEVWREITARVGVVMAAESGMYKGLNKVGRIDEAKEVLRIAERDYYLVQNSAHMLHLEQPQVTAECILEFFS